MPWARRRTTSTWRLASEIEKNRAMEKTKSQGDRAAPMATTPSSSRMVKREAKVMTSTIGMRFSLKE